MRKALKLIGFAAVTLVLFFFVASLAFYHLVRVGEFRRFLIEEIEKNTALKVELGEADLEIGWITGIVFRQVAVSEPDAARPAITAESITARVALTPLLLRAFGSDAQFGVNVAGSGAGGERPQPGANRVGL